MKIKFCLTIYLLFLIVNVFSQNIIIYGDSRSNDEMHKKILDAICITNPVAVFHTGDLVFNGYSNRQWENFKNRISVFGKNVKFYPVKGNHEFSSRKLLKQFEFSGNKLWYSVDINNIHFIVLNTDADTDSLSEQYSWLENDLKNVPDNTGYIICLFHHPPFCSSANHKIDEKGIRKTFVPLFEKYGVCATFSAHEHFYERSLYNNIYYIVTAGGGAPLYDSKQKNIYSQKLIKSYNFCKLQVIDSKLVIEVFDENLKILDSFEINKR